MCLRKGAGSGHRHPWSLQVLSCPASRLRARKHADEIARRLIAVHRRLLRPPGLLSGLSPVLSAPVAPVLSAALSAAHAGRGRIQPAGVVQLQPADIVQPAAKVGAADVVQQSQPADVVQPAANVGAADVVQQSQPADVVQPAANVGAARLPFPAHGNAPTPRPHD